MDKKRRMKKSSMNSERTSKDKKRVYKEGENLKNRDKTRERKPAAALTEEERMRRQSIRRKRMEQERQRKIARRKKFLRTLRLVLLLVLVGGGIYLIANYSEGNKLNKKGLEAYNSADYENANEYFKRAIEKDGLNYEYPMNQAMALSGLKMYDDAMPQFERALELARGDSQTQLVQRAKGISLLYQGNYDEAVAAFDAALDGKESRYSEVEMDILYYKAETLDKAGRFVDAVLVYTNIVDEEESADAYMLRGMEYVKVGDYSSAEADLRTAIKKDKKNYDIYLALYQALISQNKHEEATAVLQEALKLGGSKGEALVNQGKIYMKLGDYAQAEEKLTKALNKKALYANLALGQFYMEKPDRDPATAVGYFEAYLAEVTDDAEGYNLYGLCLMELGEYAKAEEIFTKGVALGDRLMDRSISKNQITAAEYAGHWESAFEYVDVYLQKYSDDEEALKEKEFIQTRIR